MSVDVLDPQVERAIRSIVLDELAKSDPSARRLISQARAAEFLSISVRGLVRLGASGPPFVQVGDRRRYALADLMVWQRQKTTAAGEQSQG